MKFIAQLLSDWRKAIVGSGFKTAQTNWFDSTGKTKAGETLPIEDKVRQSDNQFAWIVEYEK